jgi:DNA repair exonuclease SbcCD ATPase subunit
MADNLAEARSHCKALEETSLRMRDELERSMQTANTATRELESIMSELTTLKKTHEQYIVDSVGATEMACDEARQETIEEAEFQFKQANQLYIKLKKQYDACKAKVEQLEKDLQKATGRLELAGVHETNLKAQVTELKASKMKVEADGARKAKEYRREMERLLSGAESFEKKLKEAESSNRSNLKRLTSVLSEKEKLQKEYVEIKNVCEELMTLVENQQVSQHEC